MKQLAFVGLIALTVALAPVTHAQYTGNFQTNIISGVTSNWVGNYNVGNTTFADVLLIQNSGVLSNDVGCLGYAASSSNNGVLVSGSGSIWSNKNSLVVGRSGSGNALVISGGGKVFSSDGNYKGSHIGYTADNNSVLVSGTGSLWTTTGQIIVGYTRAGNSLVISNGGQVVDNFGAVAGFTNNSVRVVDGGVWRNGTLSVGGAFSNLVVVAGGSVFASNLTVYCGNLVQLDSGSIILTNASTNAVLNVRGKVVLNGGALQVDQFVMTDACAQFIRTGGTLIYGTAVLTTNLDADGDGMANGWEQASGLDPLNAADAGADNDGDGFTNLQEFQAGTNPTNASSAFRVLSLESTNDDILVTWQAGGGRTNMVQSAPDLTGSYSNISPTIILPGSGDVTTNYVDTGAATNAGSRFYKIRLVP